MKGGNNTGAGNKFEKVDTVTGMKLIKMDKRPGHTYDYQDKEEGMFRNQSYQKLQTASALITADEQLQRNNQRRSRAQRCIMAKILHTQTAKSPERNPVDRALIRQLDFKKRESEIRHSAID